MTEPINAICCTDIGLTMGDTTVRQLPDGTWKATCPIGTIFGSEVDGECSGTGPTKEAALEALASRPKKPGGLAIMGISIKFEPRDLWVGVYWERSVRLTTLSTDENKYRVYVCLVPCFPIIFEFWKRILLKRRYENW